MSISSGCCGSDTLHQSARVLRSRTDVTLRRCTFLRELVGALKSLFCRKMLILAINVKAQNLLKSNISLTLPGEYCINKAYDTVHMQIVMWLLWQNSSVVFFISRFLFYPVHHSTELRNSAFGCNSFHFHFSYSAFESIQDNRKGKSG